MEHFGIKADKDIWKRHKEMVSKLKDCPSMPNWWRYGFDSQEDMEEELNGER